MRYGIICAMPEEIKQLVASLEDQKKSNLAGKVFYEGRLGATPVVLVESGIGKVQAGITTAQLIVNYHADAVINSGSAGGIGKGLKIGDVVLSTQTAYHDVDATAFGYEFGQLPGQPARFDADVQLMDCVSDAAKKTVLNVQKGLIVTGDQFVASKEQSGAILEHFPDALSSEMEGAAVGQVATQYKVPYLVIRAMSDVGDEDAGVSFDEFIVEAGQRSAQMLLEMFEA